MKDKLLEIALSVVEKIKGRQLIHGFIRRKGDSLIVKGREYSQKPVYLISAGKAGVEMARGAMETLGDLINGGIVVSPYFEEIKGLEVIEGSHPYPDKKSLNAGRKLLNFAEDRKEGELVLFLISGGASSLVEVPAEPFTLEDINEITRYLLKGGATIEETNTVRRHISAIKGGRLARKLFPSRILTLAISDVKFDIPHDIGSGPTVPDPSTKEQAMEILEKYGLSRYLKKLRVVEETPKPGDPVFERASFEIIGNTLVALNFIKEEAEKRGIKTLILTGEEEGEAREIAKLYAGIIYEIKRSGNPVSPPVLLVAGGEPTVTVKGKGKGGRSTELALSLLIELEKFSGYFAILSMGTDGIDGPTDAAGVCFDTGIFERMKELSLDPLSFLENNDSYTFFQKTGGLIFTGPTGTNVRDIRLFYIG